MPGGKTTEEPDRRRTQAKRSKRRGDNEDSIGTWKGRKQNNERHEDGARGGKTIADRSNREGTRSDGKE